MFHFIHGFLLTVCLWTALDFPLSPRRLGVGFPCLPLYYLGALSVGYFSGYFLLVFGSRLRDTKRRPPPLARGVSFSLAAATWAVLVVVPAFLLCKNLPHILASRHGAFESYAAQLERSLPPRGATVLSDDPLLLFCLETALMRRDQHAANLTIDTSLLSKDSSYFQFLQRRHPEFHMAPPLFFLPGGLPNPAVLTAWLQSLAAMREVYYLHPVSSYLGEFFSIQPHGIFYQLTPRATNALEIQPLPPQLLAENQAYWRAFAAGPLAETARHAQAPKPTAGPSPWQRLLRAAHLEAESDRWALVIGSWRSRAVDAWGVQLQQANLLAEAGDCFQLALQFNPDNAAARINREFNQTLQTHQPPAVQSPQQLEGRLGNRRSWGQILAIDGPIDEPNACCKIGALFAEAHWPLQATREFARAQILAPGNADAALGLAEQLLEIGDNTNALAQANLTLQLRPGNPNGLFFRGYALVGLKDYDQAISELSDVLAVKADLRAVLARAYAYLQLGKLDAARLDYEHAAQSSTNAYFAYSGLAEVAYLQKDTAAAIKYSELYQSNAPPNQARGRLIEQRLAELRSGAPGDLKP
jgi:tetratricopeptide (TPR) repeat protein